MKISDIKDCLNSYDSNKGNIRSWIDESHIRELRKFYTQLSAEKDRQLSGPELERAAIIILSKTTWTNSESCITLSMLANRMGGKKALDYLKEKGLINAEYLIILDHYSYGEWTKLSQETTKVSTDRLSQQAHNAEAIEGYGFLIAQYLISLTAVIPLTEIITSGILDKVASATLANKKEDIKTLVRGKVIRKKAYLAVFAAENSQLLTNVLLLLQKTGLCKDSNIERLPTSQIELDLLNSILKIFDTTDGMLMLQTNLSALVEQPKRLARYAEIIIELSKASALKQPLLKKLFSAEFNFEKGQSVAGLLNQFREAEWDVAQYFEAILKTAETGQDFLAVILRLRKLGLKVPHEQLILKSLFTDLDFSENIIDGLENLCRKVAAHSLDEGEIKTMLSAPQFARKLARAIEIKRNFVSANDGTKEFIDKFTVSNPAHADGLALVLEQLAQEKLNIPETRALILTQPQNAVYAALILERMSQHNLFKVSNPQSLTNLKLLYAKGFVCAEFITLSYNLTSVNLFNQANFDKLVEKAEHFGEIVSSCFILGEKLEQSNLNLLFEEPENALKIAQTFSAEIEIQQPMDVVGIEAVPGQVSLKGSRDAFFKAAPSTKPQAKQMTDANERAAKADLLLPFGVKFAWHSARDVFQAAVDILNDGENSSEEENYEEGQKYDV